MKVHLFCTPPGRHGGEDDAAHVEELVPQDVPARPARLLRDPLHEECGTVTSITLWHNNQGKNADWYRVFFTCCV